MKNHILKTNLVAIAILTGSALINSVWALGFRNPDQDARATGQGEAFVAQADDASAIYYNPAGLAQFSGTEVTSGAYFDFAGSKFNGAIYNTSTSFLPQFYLATDFGKTNSPWRVGLGFNVPFGSAANLNATGPMSYLVTKSSLAVYNIAPSVAYRFNDHFSLGVDLNVYHGDTMSEQAVWPPSVKHFQGDGNAVGATVGALYKFNEQHTIGVVYRSPFTIDFAGFASQQPTYSSSSAHAAINFPQSVAIGYAYRPVAKLKLEVDVEWTNWDPLNTVQLYADNSALNTSEPYNWKDSWFYEFGAQYNLDEHWTARAGYIFSENSVPDNTYSPALPDGNRHVLSAGLGYQLKWIQIDITYQYSITETRNVTGSNFGLADGRWNSSGHALCATSTLRF